MLTPLIVSLALVALFTALTVWWMDRAAELSTRAERDAVSAQWEALVLQRQDLRLAVDERGEPTLHGRAAGVSYTLGALDREDGWSGLLGVQARSEAALGDLLLQRGTEVPEWLTAPAETFATGDADFDAVFTARASDVEGARARLDEGVRAAVLAIPGASLWLRDGALLVVTDISPAAVDGALIDSVGAVVSGLCAPAEQG